MADYALDFDTWGLTVSGGKVTEVSDGIAEMKQRIGIAIKTHLGEKMLDVTLGLPWMERIMVKNPSIDRITSDIRTYLLTRVEGVTGVLELRPVFDAALRKLTIYLNVETTAGVTGPFNLTV